MANRRDTTRAVDERGTADHDQWMVSSEFAPAVSPVPTSAASDDMSCAADISGADVLLLAGGRVIDPANQFDGDCDVAIAEGRIVAVGPNLAASYPAATIRDCTGLIVSPGLMDLHVHVMAGLGDFCVEPDQVGVDMGVPVLIDGGTSGVATFDISRRAIIDHPDTKSKVLAFIDPNQLYLATKDFICHKLTIANDMKNLDMATLMDSLERNADVVVGLKARACHIGDTEFSPFLDAAQSAAGDRPVMVGMCDAAADKVV